jgi:hypothetical protein
LSKETTNGRTARGSEKPAYLVRSGKTKFQGLKRLTRAGAGEQAITRWIADKKGRQVKAIWRPLHFENFQLYIAGMPAAFVSTTSASDSDDSKPTH